MQNSLTHTKHLIWAQKCAAAHKLRITVLDYELNSLLP